VADTTSTSSNFALFPTEYVVKKLLIIGSDNLQFHKWSEQKKVPPGNNKQVKWGRYKALDLPLAPLAEGIPPTPTALEIDSILATLQQFGQTIKLTDVHELTVMHDSFQNGLKQLGRAMRRIRDAQLQTVLLGGTNVFFPNNKTTRGALTTGDVPDTVVFRKMTSKLKNPDEENGEAERFPDGFFRAIWHEKHTNDMLQDVTFEGAAIRGQRGKDLERGEIGAPWHATRHFETNFGPEFRNTGDPTIVDDAPVILGDVYGGAPSILPGLKITSNNGSGSLGASTPFDLTVTAVHKKKGLEDQISGVIDVATLGGDNELILVAPTNPAYVYNYYFGADAGTRFLVASNVVAGASFTIGAVPVTGTTAPVPPAEGEIVYTSYVFGMGSFGTCILKMEEAIITPNTATDSNPLKQFRLMGYKYFDSNTILNQLQLVRLEAVSAFT